MQLRLIINHRNKIFTSANHIMQQKLIEKVCKHHQLQFKTANIKTGLSKMYANGK